jgi:hypothetical protein
MSSSNEKFEREFEAFLNQEDAPLASLYRKLPRTEPDARLDAAVQAMAHRALNPQLVATPRPGSRRRKARWVPALGAAAGLVLAAGIAYRLGPSMNDDRDSGPAPANEVISVRPLDAPKPPEPPLSPPPPPAEASMSSRPATGARAEKLQDMNAGGSRPAPVPAAAEPKKSNAAEPAAKVDAASVAADAPGKSEAAAKPAVAPKAFPAATQPRRKSPEIDAVERQQIMAEGAWQNLHDRDATDAASPDQGGAPAENETRPVGAATVPARKARPQTSIAPQSAPPPRSAPEQQELRKAGTGESTAQGGAIRRDEPARPAAAAAGATRMKSSDPNARLYPEHWLANIRKMLAQDQRADALRSLAEFRRIYPDYRLPDDLRDLK